MRKATKIVLKIKTKTAEKDEKYYKSDRIVREVMLQKPIKK